MYLDDATFFFDDGGALLSGHSSTSCACSTSHASMSAHCMSAGATLGASAAGMLSADGRCKTLDQCANGYTRSEGVGSLVVQLTNDAPSVTLSGSAVRQDGRSASLTAPNGSAQRTLLLLALGRAALALLLQVGGG